MRGGEEELSAEERRFERELEFSGDRFQIVTLWRGDETGYGILYFLDAGGADGATDRRRLRLLGRVA